MFIILVYDVGEKRVAKVLKICRKYLNWVQNSVLEGEISCQSEKLNKLKQLSMSPGLGNFHIPEQPSIQKGTMRKKGGDELINCQSSFTASY